MKLKGLCSALLCVLLLNSVNIPASAVSQESTNIIPANKFLIWSFTLQIGTIIRPELPTDWSGAFPPAL